MSVMVLFSGGVDSLCTARWAQRNFSDVQGIYYDVSQGYAKREYKQASTLAWKLKLPFHIETPIRLPEDPVTGHIDLRNIIFILLASRTVEAVCYGELKAEETRDKGPAFRRTMTHLIQSQRDTPFRIHAPYAKHTKSQMVRDYIERYGTAFLSETVACYKAEAPACGQCMSCFNRWLAWSENGLLMEPYLIHPAQWMLDKLRTMHRDKTAREWHSVNLRRAWLRRQWVIECRRQLNRYSRAVHKMSAWRYAHAT